VMSIVFLRWAALVERAEAVDHPANTVIRV
jgi:hypothetical protein